MVGLGLGPAGVRVAHADDADDVQIDPPADDADAPKDADTPPADGSGADAKQEARRLIEEGDKLFAGGDAKGALERYLAAHAAFPSPKIYYPLARAEEKLGRLGAALAHYEQFLAEAAGQVPAALKKEAQRAAGKLRPRVARVTFQVDVDGAVVTVDGRPVGSSPIEGVVYVDPGERVFLAEAEGYAPARLEQTLSAGEAAEILLDLEELAKAPPEEPRPKVKPDEPEEPEVPEVEAPRRAPPRWPLWVGLGAAGAFTSVALITGFTAVGQHDVFADETRSVEDREAARDSGKTLAVVTDVMLVGAVSAAAFSTWYYLARVRGRGGEAAHAAAPGVRGRARARRPRAGGSTLQAAPLLWPGGIGVAGRF
ncbi:MAG: PEGA domain-containing protein [Deltaproteobacteria bacterium]|nr:PEGA domain-containing protein [Deltaproteobacteria bacterium]